MKTLSSRPQARKKVRPPLLYVEDEEQNRQVAELRLSKDYELICAATDEEACQVLKERGFELSAVVMDIQLQGSQLDGIQLTRLIRGKLGRASLPSYALDVPALDLPVIFVTAYGRKHPRAELDEAGGNELIPKPVNFVDLSLALTRHHLAATTRRLQGRGAAPEGEDEDG